MKKPLDVEEMLKQLPKVRDEQLKEQIFAQVQAKMKEKKRKRTALVASVAIILFLAILLPNVFYFQKPQEQTADDAMFSGNEEKAEIFMEEAMLEDEKTYFYAFNEAMLQKGEQIATIPYFDESKTVLVPLSFVIREGENVLQRVDEIRNNFDATLFGLENTLLKTADLSEKEGKLIIQFPTKEIMQIERWLEGIEMFARSLHYEQFTILFDDQKQTYTVRDDDIYGYYVYETKMNNVMLVPFPLEVVSFSEALEKMKDAPDKFIKAPIPKEASFRVEERGKDVYVRFHEPIRLKDETIEAILLAAKHFQYDYVQFEGEVFAEQKSIYNFKEKLSTKLFPNGM